MKTLSSAQIKSIKEPGRYRAGVGLYLVVKPSGSKSWIQRIVIYGKRHDVGLGGYPDVSLAQAREQAAQNRIDIADGGNPVVERRRATTPTLREAAERVHLTLIPTWKSDQHAIRWMRTLRKDVFPKLGDIPIDQVTKSDLLNILEPIWHTKAETARRIRQRLKVIFRWAMAHDYLTSNPAGEQLDGGLPNNTKSKKPHRALPYQEVPEAWERISRVASPAARLCLKWTILTATRSGEARGARWSEIDFEARTWTVPGERMKGGKPHRVPLSTTALNVLEEARTLRDDSGLVFPSRHNRGQPQSDMTLMMLLRRLGLAERTTVHGFRSSFRVWSLEQTNTPWEVAEAALAHELGSPVARAYARSDLLDRRRPLMENWAGFLTESEKEG